jgi:hypothetical protein
MTIRVLKIRMAREFQLKEKLKPNKLVGKTPSEGAHVLHIRLTLCWFS